MGYDEWVRVGILRGGIFPFLSTLIFFKSFLCFIICLGSFVGWALFVGREKYLPPLLCFLLCQGREKKGKERERERNIPVISGVGEEVKKAGGRIFLWLLQGDRSCCHQCFHLLLFLFLWFSLSSFHSCLLFFSSFASYFLSSLAFLFFLHSSLSF